MTAERVFFIADDSPSKLTMLRGILHAAGWRGDVLVAKTTEEALSLLEATPAIDAAFVDYYIPSENGPAIIHALRTRFPSAKIALVSSADNAENAQEARDAGANNVLCTTLPDSEERIRDLLFQWKVEWTA